MNRFNDFRYRFRSQMAQFMYGRNGLDAMARTVYITAIVLFLINLFANNAAISAITLILFGYSVFRVYSKNIPKRYAENQMFMEKTKIPRKYLGIIPMQVRDIKTSRYYVCSKCHQQIRVPRGKGKIEITCPKCRNSFVKRT